MKHFLEKTTNTHVLEASKIKVLKTIESTEVLTITGKGFLTHGEHGCIIIESEHVIKYVQQEYNPITKVIENAYD